MNDAQLAALLPLLSGDYGFTLGYRERDDGPVRIQRNKHRQNFAVAGDKPGPNGTNSPNHGGTGQHVLHDDGSVGFQLRRARMNTTTTSTRILRGRSPRPVVGDAVIVPSETRTK